MIDARKAVERIPDERWAEAPAAAATPVPVHRGLTAEQRQALLDVPGQLDTAAEPREVLQQLATLIGDVLRAKVALAGKREREWIVSAESAADPAVPVEEQAPHAFDRLSATPGLRIETWRAGERQWTLIGLSTPPDTPVVLVLEHDWTESAVVLRELAGRLAHASGDGLARPPLPVVVQQLTRALADTTGLAAVGETILQHVVQVVPTRLASVAVVGGGGDLTIVATHGYPRELVEHLRIPSGNGVIGQVCVSRMPMVVSDVSQTPGFDRRRLRYRTDSFAAIPIVAGAEALGVVSLTDRTDGRPFSTRDVDAVARLMAPAALALGRERVWREAQAYAQAAVIDPVSGLFNRRYFEARLEEELQRALRQSTSVGLLMVDLDEFKAINDRFGHVAGDVVIRDISEILRQSVRIFDVCTRFGGEEFAVMMPGGTHDSVVAIAERIRQRIEAYTRTGTGQIALRATASIGMAVSPPGLTARDLIERADRALYHAKRTGKNRVSIADADGRISPAL